MKNSFLFLLLSLLFCSGMIARPASFPLPGETAVSIIASAGIAVGDYPTLKSAFEAINSGTHKGDIFVRITSSTREDGSSVLFGSGTGNANYTSVKIFPTTTGLSITGNLSAPLIDFNGADHVTIDGSLNGTGSSKDLVISNTSNSVLAPTSTIRFINAASENIIKHCVIKGSGKAPTGGIILFSSSTGISGNDNNTITSNDITSANDTDRPVMAICSLGSNGLENSGNRITDNNIYDFLNRGQDSFGICLPEYSSQWTITGNSFYETTEFIPAGKATYGAIYVYFSGGGYTISDNYIGGSAPLCGGMAWTKSDIFDSPFLGINVITTLHETSNFQNNTINNFNWNNKAGETWAGIAIMDVGGGTVNMGTITGNTIGSVSGSESIKISGTDEVYGIVISGNGTFNCRNNVIRGVTAANESPKASNIYGINIVNFNNGSISDNRIENISTTSLSTATAQSLYGIYSDAVATFSIDNNTISNLVNGSTNTDINTPGLVNGITSAKGELTLSGNTIRNLTIGNANNSINDKASVSGIVLSGISSQNTVTGNVIYNLSNINPSFIGCVMGLYFNGNEVNNKVAGNFIHSLTALGDAIIFGIKIISGVTTYANNIISLAGDNSITICGIYDTGANGQHTSLFFNTVYIGGRLGSGVKNKSYAFLSSASGNNRNVRNNIFVNERSTVGGTNLHYATYFDYATEANLTVDYNNYYAPGNGGVLGYFGGNNFTSVPVDFSFDAHDLSINPGFIHAGGTTAVDYIPVSQSLSGTSIASVINDYKGSTRNLTSPTMGAFEFMPAPAVTSFSPASGVVGTTVRISGANFTGATEVKFGGVEATSFTVTSPTSITAVLASGSSGDLSVITPAGKALLGGFTYLGTLIWTGAISGDWNTAGNWSPAMVPLTGSNITIPEVENDPVISDFTLSTSGVLTLSSKSVLTVTGTLTNNGEISILSDILGTGSFIAANVTGSGKASVQRYMTSNAWHLVSSPVPGQELASLLTTNTSIATASNGIHRGIMDYNPAENKWNPLFMNSTGGNLSIGKGFSVRVNEGSETVTFRGAIQTGNVMMSGLISDKWNCLGNPYTSAIGINSRSASAADFLTVNGVDAGNIDPLYGIYIWNQADANNGKSGQYTAISNVPGSVNELQQGQAFFVKMNTSASEVIFTPAMQLHQTTLSLKSARNPWPTIKLEAAVNNQNSSAIIAFSHGMTKGPDPTYDAGLFKGDADLVVYTKLIEDIGIPFAIQALPDIRSGTMIIPAGIDSKAGGELIISAEIRDLPSGYKVILEDRTGHSFTDLSNGVYRTTIAAGSTVADRFFIHTSATGIELENQLPSGNLKVSTVRNIELRITGEVSGHAVATLYDMPGRVVLVKNLEAGFLNVIDLPTFKNGIYLLKVNDNGCEQTFKLAIIG